MSKAVRPKKHLGQHFLTDLNIAQKIASTLTYKDYNIVIEVGPGTGVLTQFLLKKPNPLYVFEVDPESVAHLQAHFKAHPHLEIFPTDFLKAPLDTITQNQAFAITGNFPYNISSQIVFKLLDYVALVPEFTGMFQKEVAERICQPKGTKQYGILSVLVQAYYTTQYLFTVPPQVFNPPPKVDSGVLRLQRKPNYKLRCSEILFKKIVKMAFQQRRKTLRNSLKALPIPEKLKEDSIFGQRPEQLSAEDFIGLTQKLEQHAISTHH